MESAQKIQTETVNTQNPNISNSQMSGFVNNNVSIPSSGKKTNPKGSTRHNNQDSNTQIPVNSKFNRRGRKRSHHKTSDENCVAELQGRPCKLKSLVGSKYCRHHAAFDPDSAYQFCEHFDRRGKQCQISVSKTATIKFCNNHKKKYAEKGIDLKGLKDPVPPGVIDDDLELNDNDDDDDEEEEYDEEDNEDDHHPLLHETPMDSEDKPEDDHPTHKLPPLSNLDTRPSLPKNIPTLKFNNPQTKILPPDHIKTEGQPKANTFEISKYLGYMPPGNSATGIPMVAPVPNTNTVTPTTTAGYDPSSLVYPSIHLSQFSSLPGYYPGFQMLPQWNKK